MARSISFEQAADLAKSGDAEAQYALSSVLHRRGKFAESAHWLRLAASQKLISAQITLAMLLIDGRHCARDLQQAADILRPLAATEIQANLKLSELYGFTALQVGDRASGLRHLAAAARLGDAGALRQLALLGACHKRWDLTRPLLDASARRGDAAAAYALAYSYAAGVGGASEPARAAFLASSAAVRSQYLSDRLLKSLPQLGSAPSAGTAAALPIDWSMLEESLPTLAAPIRLPDPEVLNEVPLVRRLPGVIPPLVLDTLINMAAPLVERSQIVDARTGDHRADPMRNSSHVTLGPRQHDHVIEALERCIGDLAGLPVLNGEFLQILRYRRGEQFKPHVDYFNESGAGAYRALADGGQRVQTVLTYLNDDFDGGATSFPQLGLTIRGRTGDMLHFHNLGRDGMGHKDSLHAGMPVISGEKWLLSQWIRAESYPLRVSW